MYLKGMQDSGTNETQINLFLSAMNIDPIPDELMEQYKKMVGTAVENVVIESCSKAKALIEEEVAKTNDVLEDE